MESNVTQTYIVRPGSIASVQYITLPDGQQATAIFLGPDPWFRDTGSYKIETPAGSCVPQGSGAYAPREYPGVTLESYKATAKG